MLAIDADLALEIDGRPATLKASGRRLVLHLESARMLRGLVDVSLPRLPDARFTRRNAATVLTGQGLTLEIHDGRGPLLVLGKNAEGNELSLPGVGTFADARLASRTALLRLAFSR